jgi:hypothetical protein
LDFNNREIAIGIWLTIFIVLACTKPDIRSSLRDLINAFLQRKIAILIHLMGIYTLILIFLLARIDLWEVSQTKNTILWFFSTALVSFTGFSNIDEDPHYFRDAFKDNLKIVVLIEFILSFYTFNLGIELCLVPFVILLGCTLAIAKSSQEYKIVEVFINRLMEFMGLIIICFSVYKLITSFGEFAQIKTIYDLIVPSILSILILPYLYALSLYKNYETEFIKIQIFLKDKSLYKYAKYISIFRFNIHINYLRRWSKILSTGNISSKQDINTSISDFYKLLLKEKNPPNVAKADGWSPYSAADFLLSEGLKTGYYQHCYNNDWFASSPYLKIGEELLSSNNISYYIEGDSNIVRCLKLVLNINNSSNSIESHKVLLAASKQLFSNALDKNMPNELEHNILNGDNKEMFLDSSKIRIFRNDWSTNKGYDVKFSIEKIKA